MDKASLRKHFIPRRKGAHVGDPAEVAQRVQALLPSEDFVLASYLPIRGEWDPWPVIQAMPAHETAIPDAQGPRSLNISTLGLGR